MSLLDFLRRVPLWGPASLSRVRTQMQPGALSTTACHTVTPVSPAAWCFPGWSLQCSEPNSANGDRDNGKVRSRVLTSFLCISAAQRETTFSLLPVPRESNSSSAGRHGKGSAEFQLQ